MIDRRFGAWMLQHPIVTKERQEEGECYTELESAGGFVWLVCCFHGVANRLEEVAALAPGGHGEAPHVHKGGIDA